MTHENQTALVTGANAGLGFDAAAQLAERGYGHVILACRTIEKAEAARKELVERVGNDVFDVLAIDVADLEASKRAAQTLIEQGRTINLLVLNAGLARTNLERTGQGIEMTLAASLFGHHLLTMELLAADRLAPDAHIVIAGSESARGDVPTFGVPDYDAVKEAVGGNLDAAMDAVARGEQPERYSGNSTYANAKLWVAWWAAALSRRLPDGMVVVAVSPGSAPGTTFARNMSAPMRLIMLPMMKVIGPFFGMAGPVAQGAQRYVDAGDFAGDASGKFWASPPGKAVGPMEVQKETHFADETLQEAAWDSVVRLTGIGVPIA
ncbi:MAG: SDR family NAD(P)-dependent oxidoreductase [Chloroflexi bacterium]|nr:SDR family NAD(P)-dependent oxidoreductase [Chloroflexota bacterium]MCI0889598.1 SDR family NAD(P)-dependent oxidoreductase [Chloroflexota bacterium]